MNLTTELLLKLRGDATLERNTILERRGRAGEDPLTALAEMPTVDEFVVFALRDELLEQRGKLAEYSLARFVARSSAPDAAEHQANADRAEFELLREIAVAVPSLTTAVWKLAAQLKLPEPPDN